MLEKIQATPLGDIHYWTDGEPQNSPYTLVFLPGLTADHRLFDRQMEYFSGKYPLLVWDAPGHGASWPFQLEFSLMDKAKWLGEILEREQVERPVLIGQSMGGYVAQAFAQQFKGRLAGFISIDSAPLQRRYITAVELWLLKRMEPVYRYFPWKLLVKSGVRGCAVSAYGRKLMRDIMMAYDGDKERYARLSGHGFRMLALAIEADLPYLPDCPSLLLCGKCDQAGSSKRYNKAWHKTAGIPLIWIENAGHNSNSDQPELVNGLIEDFVRKLGTCSGKLALTGQNS